MIRHAPLLCITPFLAGICAAAETASYTGTAFGTGPQIIPGTIEIERYDVAPGNQDGITFHYRGTPKASPFRPAGDAIGIAGFGPGHVTTAGAPEAADQIYAGWTQSGEWWRYTVDVAEAGTYALGGHFAAGGNGGVISVAFVSPNAAEPITTGPLKIPTTAGFQPGVEVYHVWEKLDHMATMTLPAGRAVLTVKIEVGAGLNLDSLTFTKVQ
jgi:hypothetical protein